MGNGSRPTPEFRREAVRLALTSGLTRRDIAEDLGIVFARKIVGWRVSTSMTTGFVLDALNQVICQRAPSEAD